MPSDPQKVAEAREWLKRARTDLESAALLMASQPPHIGPALFHCQQAAEKAWKAFLFWNDVPFRKTHDLRELGNACASVDETLAGLAERAEDLTAFAWLFRYPGAPQDPSPEEAAQALAVAGEVFDAVQSRLPDEARP